MITTKIYVRPSDERKHDMSQWILIHTTGEGEKVIEPRLVDAVNEISSLSFSVYADSNIATLLNPDNRDKHEVWVCEYIEHDTDPYDDGYRGYWDEGNNIWRKDVFVGHAVEYTPYFADNGLLTYKILCVDHRDYLNRSVQKRREYQLLDDGTGGYGGSKGRFSEFLTEHNYEVGGDPFGRSAFMHCDYDVNNNFNKYHYVVDWEVTYNALMERFVERFGGDLYIDNEHYGTKDADDEFLHGVHMRWGTQGTERTDTTITKGYNLKSLRVTTDASEVCTRLFPLGATLDDGSRVTIKGVSEGGRDPKNEYIDIDDTAYIQAHGITARTVTWDDVTDPINLYRKALAWLANENRVRKTYEAEILDLSASVYADGLTRLRCGDTVLVQNDDMGIDERLRIIRIEYDLSQLQNVSVTFGDKFYSDIKQELKDKAETTQKINTLTYNSNAVATKLENNQKLLTSEQQTSGGDMAHSTLSGKEISTEWWNGTQRMGKIGYEADKEGLAGYAGSSTAPSILITNYGEIITDGNLTLRGTYSDVLINVNGQYVSLRNYIATHP